MGENSRLELERRLAEVPKGQLCMTKHGGTPESTCFMPEVQVDTDGRGLADHYPLFDGVTLTHYYYQASQYTVLHPPMSSILQINHCRYGRIGWKMDNGVRIYLGPGDLSLHTLDACANAAMSFPLGCYEGIAISVDLDCLNWRQPEILKDANIDGKQLREKFCRQGTATAMPAGSAIEHVFAELYQLPEHCQIPYCKLKVQELLLLLSVLEPEERLNQYLEPQVETIQAVHQQLTEHPEHRYTIEELAKHYLMNTSSLKAVFKSVYGLPIATYMKTFRMQRAAERLRESDDSIAMIATQVGYENQSKFSAAFKEMTQMLPTDYRKRYRSIGHKR